MYTNFTQTRIKLTERETAALDYWFTKTDHRDMMNSDFHSLYHLLNIALIEYIDSHPHGSSHLGTHTDFSEMQARLEEMTHYPKAADFHPVYTVELSNGIVYNYGANGKFIGEAK